MGQPTILGSIARASGVFAGLASVIGLLLWFFDRPNSDNLALFSIIAASIALSITMVIENILTHVGYKNYISPNGRDNPRIEFLSDKETMKSALYESNDSVVKSAKEQIVVTGSRSRLSPYLDALERKIYSKGVFRCLRILIGPAKNQALVDHIARIADKCGSTPGWPEDKFAVVEFPLGGDMPERFMCISERKAFIAVQSINTPLGYDSAIVIHNEAIARAMVGQLRAAAEAQERAQRQG